MTLGPNILKNWNHYLLFKNWSKAIDDLETTWQKSTMSSIIDRVHNRRIPTFFSTEFVLDLEADLPLDAFLRLDGWRKGLAFLNGFNLGRYWTVGPQITLYAPKHLFEAHPNINKLIVFELETVPNNRTVQFVDQSELNAKTPYEVNKSKNKTETTTHKPTTHQPTTHNTLE